MKKWLKSLANVLQRMNSWQRLSLMATFSTLCVLILISSLPNEPLKSKDMPRFKGIKTVIKTATIITSGTTWDNAQITIPITKENARLKIKSVYAGISQKASAIPRMPNINQYLVTSNSNVSIGDVIDSILLQAQIPIFDNQLKLSDGITINGYSDLIYYAELTWTAAPPAGEDLNVSIIIELEYM